MGGGEVGGERRRRKKRRLLRCGDVKGGIEECGSAEHADSVEVAVERAEGEAKTMRGEPVLRLLPNAASPRPAARPLVRFDSLARPTRSHEGGIPDSPRVSRTLLQRIVALLVVCSAGDASLSAVAAHACVAPPEKQERCRVR